jgi:uncharacterized DUF497 family protein
MGDTMFEWDDANVQHIARHDVTPGEAEQAVTIAAIELDYENIEGEERVRLIGITAKARLLTVVITVRYDRIRVVTAYPATRSQERIYFNSAGYKNGY